MQTIKTVYEYVFMTTILCIMYVMWWVRMELNPELKRELQSGENVDKWKDHSYNTRNRK